MGMEIGLSGLLILAADVWAMLNIFQSGASTGVKVAWIVGVLVFPVVGFFVWLFAGPRENK
jgi:hypothetical protein